MPKFRTQLLAGAAFSIAMLMGAPSFAQDQGAHAEVDADTGTELDSVIITATKRETNLQTTPVAVSVVGAQATEDRHVESLLDLSDGLPSLRVATFESRQSALTIGIRGIVPFDANQTARDQGVGVYIDGVYLGRQQGLNAALFDVERIEVLRGPQGTLFGRNAEGGALSIVTRAPTGVFGGRVIGGVGNFNAYNGEAHIDLPEVANFSVKLDALIQHQDPFVENPLEGEAGWGQYHRVGGRLSVLWAPTDSFKIDLAVDKARDENTPFYSQLLNYNPQGKIVRTVADMILSPTNPPGTIAPLPAMVQYGESRMETADIGVPQQPSVDVTQGISANLTWDISENLEFRSITAYREVATHQWDNSGGAHRTPFTPNGRFSRYSLSDLGQDQFSQEFQLVGSAGDFEYVAGLYYFNENVREEAATPSTNQWNSTGTAYTILSPNLAGNAWQHGLRSLQRASKAEATSYAVFGQATWTPGGFDRLHLTVGGRWTHDERDGVLYKVRNLPTNFVFTYEDERFDPMVTVAFDAAEDINLYAKYSTGYRAGGANSRSQTFNAFGAEEVKAYELGAKMDFLDHRVRLNLAAYWMDRDGTQTDFDNVDTNPLSPTFNLHTEETANAPGTSKIKGFEAELLTRPVEGLTLGVNYAYTDVEVPETPNPFLGGGLTQVYTVYTPENAVSAFVDWEMPVSFGELRAHLDASYADEQYSFQSESVQTDSSFVVNASIALGDVKMPNTDARATFRLWSRNLLDETFVYRRSAANAGTLGDYGNLNPPRTFGVEMVLEF